MASRAFFSRVLDPDIVLARLARATNQPWWRNVLTGLAFAAGGLAVRWALQMFYAEVTGFIILLPAVILAALAGGRVAGMVTTVACLLGGWAIAGPGALGVGIATPIGRVATVNFVLVGLFSTLVAASLRKTVAQLDGMIGALKTSQAQVDESETRFRDISDVAPVMLWTADANGRAYVNAEFRRFWGDRSMSLADPAPWMDAIHEGDRDRVFAASMGAFQAQTALALEARYLRADGEWRLIQTHARPRFGADGGFIGMVGANIDITDMREAEDALRRNDAELTAMVNQAAAGIARVDMDGRVVSSNTRFAQLLGHTPESIIGLTTSDASHPDDVKATLELLSTIMDGGDGGQLEKRYVRPDGSVVWALTSLRALRDDDGAQSGYIAVTVDISDAKAAEAALRESESRFRLMADTAPSPVWLTNAEGEVEFVNAALVEFYGKPGETFMGHAWKASIHPDDIAEVNATQAEARAHFLPYGFECRFMRHDGAWRWMRVSVNPRFDGEGTFQGYVGLSFDVTGQREALDALAQQERRQRFLLELSDGVRDLTDPDDVIDHAQSVLGRVLGVSRVGYGELDTEAGVYHLRRDWTEGVPSIVGDTRIEDFGRAVSDGMLDGRTVVVAAVADDPRTSANLAHYEAVQIGAFVVVPLFRSGVLRAFINIQSATPRAWTPGEVKLVEDVADRAWSEVERTRAQSEVRESEARFRDIADTAPVLIWVTQQDRTRAFVNQAYVEFMGGDYESVRTADWRTYIHPDDQDMLVRESIAGEATRLPFALEARYRHNSGEYRWLKSFSRPRFGPGGEVIGFVGVAFDVTDARRGEYDLKRINELLEDRVGDALAEKAKAEADLMHAQRMEAVGRLTGGVAHDFNNLLTVVIGALDLILKSPEDAARRHKLGEAALSAARRGERLTHQLLAFSRRQALRPEAIDINALIRESDPLLRRAVGEAVGYKLKLRRGGARVIVDPAQFEAALLNLIVNARDAVAERGATEGAQITVQTQACEVAAGEVIELSPGDYVCVTVSDTGAGMDEETMRRVFEPFFTTKAVGKGTGLGLSQVYGFARQSGGGVGITSTVGQGTEIRVYLPPAPVEQDAAEAPRRALGSMRAGQTLLLVEDDAGVAAIAMDLLRGMGLEVEAAETGPEALTLLEQRRFDVMLSDIVMPGGMTGIELARTCAERWPAMSIMLTSGYAGDDVDLALADAPWPFLRKPYSGEQLREALGDLSVTAGGVETP